MSRAVILVLAFLLTIVFPGISRAAEFGPVEMHGYVSQGYLLSSHNNYLAQTEAGTTEFNEIAINASTDLSEKLRVGLQLLARDLGDSGNDEVNLDWGYGDYHWRDELGIRIGKVKRPMGLYNEGRDVDMLRTWILLPQSVYREDMRDVMNAAKGGALYGTLPAGSLGRFDYQHVYGSKDIDLENIALKRQFINFFPGVDMANIQTNIKYTDTSHVLWHTPLKGLVLGGTFEVASIEVNSPAVAAMPTNDPDIYVPARPARHLEIDLKSVWVGSLQYRWYDLTLAAEYLSTVQELTLDSGPGANVRQKVHSEGYYGSIDYRFTPWLEVGSYYSVYYPNRKDRDGDTQAAYGNPYFKAWQKDACLTVRFDITPNWICKLEGHHIDGTAQVFDYDDVGELERAWNLFAAKFTFSF